MVSIVLREGSEEGIFNILGNLERHAVCIGQRVSDVGQGSSINVEGNCSNLNDQGGVSFWGSV